MKKAGRVILIVVLAAVLLGAVCVGMLLCLIDGILSKKENKPRRERSRRGVFAPIDQWPAFRSTVKHGVSKPKG